MVEAQQQPAARPVEIGRLQRRFIFAGLPAAGDRAAPFGAFDPAVELCDFATQPLCSSFNQPHYIDAMNALATGPVATEMLRRLEAALSPTRIELIDDSEQHRGHGGYNPAGESHFTLFIESAAFAGKSRVSGSGWSIRRSAT